MFKDKLKELRKKHGQTQAQLGECIGVTQQAIERWENGRTEPNSSTLIQLSNFFGVTTDYLLDNLDEEEELNIPSRNNIISAITEMYEKLEPAEKQVITKYVEDVIKSMGYVKKSDEENK